MSPHDVHPLANLATETTWIRSNLRLGDTVGSIVPKTFESYIRIFHSAYLVGPDYTQPVTWSTVALANHRVWHAQMQWMGIVGSREVAHEGTQQGIWNIAPSMGTLPREQATALAENLTVDTHPRDRSYAAVWDGIPDLNVPDTAALIEVSDRSYRVISLAASDIDTRSLSRIYWQTPNLLWPPSHQWFVATDIDAESTYVGASSTIRQRLLSDVRLEAVEVQPGDSLRWDSDHINVGTT